ncbi:MAG: sigma-70 family RNA polymerase sigma factor [Oscillospiraceae bacterium]|nr:sigma-70 family RNA polymerase sigma factor [Oscillospiraceae bacterium]
MEDFEIIGLYFKKDEKAIEKTSEKYGAYCKAIAENILKNPEDSEECLNSALFCLWNSVPPEEPKNLKIYLAKITRNLALNMLKRNLAEKRGGNEKPSAFDEISECVPAGNSVEESFDAKELEKNIGDFVKKLPERERNIFIRRYFFFEAEGTIGKRYGYSENRISVILHRVRKKLRRYLEKEGFLYEKR